MRRHPACGRTLRHHDDVICIGKGCAYFPRGEHCFELMNLAGCDWSRPKLTGSGIPHPEFSELQWTRSIPKNWEMDLYGVIRALYAEKDKLDRTIAALEELPNPSAGGSARRRGRKSMSAEERREVSERMKKYWANRRPAKASRE
jgi:hypothetical protein